MSGYIQGSYPHDHTSALYATDWCIDYDICDQDWIILRWDEQSGDDDYSQWEKTTLKCDKKYISYEHGGICGTIVFFIS